MKKVIFVFLISCFSLTIISCGDEDEESTTEDTTTVDTTTVVKPEQMGGAMQGVELSLSTVVSRLAGGSTGSANGTGTSASFYNPKGITTDGTNLYVADYNNHLIRKIE